MVTRQCHVIRKKAEKKYPAPVREVNLRVDSQARVGLERHSQLFRTNIADRVVREPVGV
jgi:hypothetical protein